MIPADYQGDNYGKHYKTCVVVGGWKTCTLSASTKDAFAVP